MNRHIKAGLAKAKSVAGKVTAKAATKNSSLKSKPAMQRKKS